MAHDMMHYLDASDIIISARECQFLNLLLRIDIKCPYLEAMEWADYFFDMPYEGARRFRRRRWNCER